MGATSQNNRLSRQVIAQKYNNIQKYNLKNYTYTYQMFDFITSFLHPTVIDEYTYSYTHFLDA